MADGDYRPEDGRRDTRFVNAEAPTIAELLAVRGVPRQHHDAARLAFATWLLTWRGALAQGDPDDTVQQLYDRAGGGR